MSSQLEIDAEHARQLLEQRTRVFIEDRLRVAQWCQLLVKHYNNLTDDIRAKLPALPGESAEQMLPSLFVEDPKDFDCEAYKRESAVLEDIQQKMNALCLDLSKEAIKCLSEQMPQS